MSINFPSAPAEGAAYTFNGITYTFTSGVWVPAGGGGGAAGPTRELLLADRTYYVRPFDGNDANNGLANTPAGAFLTIQRAVTAACGVDLGVFNVVIQCGTGTYTAPVVLKSYVGGGTITLKGDSVTPANVVISTTSADAINLDSVRGKWVLDGLKLQTATSGSCLGCFNGSTVEYKNIDWGVCAGVGHMYVAGKGDVLQSGPETISGNAAYHYALQGSSRFASSVRTTTISGAITMTAWCSLDHLSAGSTYLPTYNGAMTGKKYEITAGSIFQSYGTQPPGSAAGTTGTNGLFI